VTLKQDFVQASYPSWNLGYSKSTQEYVTVAGKCTHLTLLGISCALWVFLNSKVLFLLGLQFFRINRFIIDILIDLQFTCLLGYFFPVGRVFRVISQKWKTRAYLGDR